MNAADNKDIDKPSPDARRVAVVTITLAVSWLSVNAIWGLTSDNQTRLSSQLASVMPLGFWLALGLFFTLGVALYGLYSRITASLAFAFMLFSYLVGVSVSRYRKVKKLSRIKNADSC